jgi:hypothetical protein
MLLAGYTSVLAIHSRIINFQKNFSSNFRIFESYMKFVLS